MATYHQLFDHLGVATGGVALPSLMTALGIDVTKHNAFVAALRDLDGRELLVLNVNASDRIIVSRISHDPNEVHRRVFAAGIPLEEELGL